MISVNLKATPFDFEPKYDIFQIPQKIVCRTLTSNRAGVWASLEENMNFWEVLSMIKYCTVEIDISQNM
jgi:hypothetical protein